MAVHFVAGDLFCSGAQTIAHGCNCRGRMGAGIALEFKSRYPEMFREYRRRCHQGLFLPGGYYLFKERTPWVLNLATQEDLGGARLNYVERCLLDFCNYYEQEKITNLAMPMIGAGLGGLEGSSVKELICTILGSLPIPVYVYEEFVCGVKGE